MAKAKNRYLAVVMLTAADVTRYSRLLEDLDKDYTKGNDNYPHTVTDAYNLIIKYRQARPTARIYHDTEGVAFANIEEGGQYCGLKDRSHIRCFNGQTMGHYANKFPTAKKEDGATPAAAHDATANVTVASQFLIAGEEFE
jgi:hypothetical protein